MKFLFAFALVAVASAANIKPVVLPRAALPEVVESSVQVIESAPEAVKLAELPQTVETVRVAALVIDDVPAPVDQVRVAVPVFDITSDKVRVAAIPSDAQQLEAVERVKVAPIFVNDLPRFDEAYLR